MAVELLDNRVKRPHLIRVHVIEARGLYGMDDTGMSDGLCVINIGPTSQIRRNTETKPHTVNAVWERTFTLEDVMLTEHEFAAEKISLRVYNRNDFFANELVGMFEFSLENVHRQKGHEYYRKWVPLQLPHDPREERGYLMLSVYVLKENDPTPNHDEVPDEPEEVLVDPNVKAVGARKPYLLNVLVYKASGLLATHSFRGSLNPFVSVRFNGNSLQTKRMTNLTAPVWNKKCVFPFFMPLTSDSIEIQVWNSVTARPDVMIGSRTFSFFKLQLATRPWGPQWINLYSSHYIPPQTTRLGSWMDWISGGSDTSTESEYVGRLLCRISVAPLRRGHPHRLLQAPCNPTAEPPGVEYALNFLLYGGSEIPVLGGKCQVEICFGAQRLHSKAVLGNNGIFNWNERFEPIMLYCPMDLDQVSDVIINIYHQSGLSSRKIAYERINVRQLMPKGNQGFWVNGEEEAHAEWTSWQPKWRTMSHVYPDPERTHVIAGFLMCSIGFGIRKEAPPRIPQLLKYQAYPYALKLRIHQAANLPPCDDKSSANPFLVVRFAGQSRRLDTRQDTLYPFWYQNVELNTMVDRKHAPSLYISVYHDAGRLSSPIFLGRCEILAKDLFDEDNQGRLFRFPLYSEENHRMSLTAKELDKMDDDVPYVLASFMMVEDQAVLSAGVTEAGERRLISAAHKSRNTLPRAVPYSLKIEPIGFRKVDPVPRKPKLEVSFANFKSKDDKDEKDDHGDLWHTVTIDDLDKPEGTTIAWQEALMLQNVELPASNLFGLPLRIRLLDGKDHVCTHTVPVAKFIEGVIERPPWYVYDSVLDQSDEEEDKNEEEDEEEEKKKESRGIEQKIAVASSMDAPTMLDLDPLRANVTIESKHQADGAGKRNMRAYQQVEENKEDVLNEIEDRKEFQEEHHVYREFTLFRGDPNTSTPPGRAKLFNQARYGSRGAVLKCFCRVAPALAESKLQNDDLLEPIRDLYTQPYTTRLYIYRGVNIAPKDKLLQGRQTCNPYLVVRNGDDDAHIYSDRVNLHKEENNPDFYTVVELPAELPANNELNIGVWDAHEITSAYDEEIGSTTIDLEWRMLHKMQQGDHEYRMLTKPGSRLSYGKILMRLEIMTEDAARRKKADDLRPPQPTAYELRLVMWNTRNVRFGEEKMKTRDVDQKMYVTSNFTGEYGQETIKDTDVAWYSSGGSAEWNWRMKWPVYLPSKVPRFKIAVWDYSELGTGTSIGEVIFNLKPFFDRCLREKLAKNHNDARWISFRHPNFPGVKVGEVNIELWMLTQVEADQAPVGEAQKEPNRDPFLPNPSRNLPPWAVASRGLGMLARYKAIAMCICALAVIVPLVILGTMGGVP